MSTQVGIDIDARVARSSDIIFTELDDTVVMMDVEKGRYYELDPVGASIWALLESEVRVSKVCDSLAEQYDVRPETCRRDVREFLGELRELGIVRVRE